MATARDAKREPTLFSTSFDRFGKQRVKVSKAAFQTLVNARDYVKLLAAGCPALNGEAGTAEEALDALVKRIFDLERGE